MARNKPYYGATSARDIDGLPELYNRVTKLENEKTNGNFNLNEHIRGTSLLNKNTKTDSVLVFDEGSVKRVEGSVGEIAKSAIANSDVASGYNPDYILGVDEGRLVKQSNPIPEMKREIESLKTNGGGSGSFDLRKYLENVEVYPTHVSSDSFVVFDEGNVKRIANPINPIKTELAEQKEILLNLINLDLIVENGKLYITIAGIRVGSGVEISGNVGGNESLLCSDINNMNVLHFEAKTAMEVEA